MKHRLALKHLVHFKRLKDSAGVYHNYTYPDYIGLPFDPADEYPYPVEAMDMTYDGLHPSDKADALIAKRLVQRIQEIIITAPLGSAPPGR